jgi:hypothetical protein
LDDAVVKSADRAGMKTVVEARLPFQPNQVRPPDADTRLMAMEVAKVYEAAGMATRKRIADRL